MSNTKQKAAYKREQEKRQQPKKEPLSDFDKIVNDRLNKTRELLLVKGKEYVRGDDRFHNFVRAAEMNRTTPTRALHGMLTKHLVSILDITDSFDIKNYPSKELISEKIGDIITYLCLQEALMYSIIDTNKLE